MHPRDSEHRTEIYHAGIHPGTIRMEYRRNRWPRFWRATFTPDEPIAYARADGDICREMTCSPSPAAVAREGAVEAALMAFEGELGCAARAGWTGI